MHKGNPLFRKRKFVPAVAQRRMHLTIRKFLFLRPLLVMSICCDLVGASASAFQHSHVGLITSRVDIVSPADSSTVGMTSKNPQFTSDTDTLEKKLLFSRISSSEAAELIESSSRDGTACGNNGLLVITTDASGGSGRFHGLCAILRQIGAAQSDVETTIKQSRKDIVSIISRRTRTVQQCTGRRKSKRRRSNRARRIGKGMGSVLDIPAELSAAVLGIRAALDYVSKHQRPQILLLLDCERSLNYLCDGLYDGGDALGRALEALTDDTSNGAISVAAVASVSKSRYDGFFDHAVADYIAGLARGRPNSSTSDSSAEEKRCPALNECDLQWLASSDVKTDYASTDPNSRTSNTVSSAAVMTVGEKLTAISQSREEGKLRIDRLLERIEKELGDI